MMSADKGIIGIGKKYEKNMTLFISAEFGSHAKE